MNYRQRGDKEIKNAEDFKQAAKDIGGFFGDAYGSAWEGVKQVFKGGPGAGMDKMIGEFKKRRLSEMLEKK